MQNCFEDDMVMGEIGKIYRDSVENLRENNIYTNKGTVSVCVCLCVCDQLVGKSKGFVSYK